MRRREFITLLSGAAAWPLAAHAQQPAMPVIGLLSGTSPGAIPHLLAAFDRGLAENGFINGRDVAIDYHWTDGRFDCTIDPATGQTLGEEIFTSLVTISK